MAGCRQKQIPEIDGEAVHQQRVVEARSPARQRRSESAIRKRRKQHADEGADGVDPLPLPGNHQVDQQNAEREDGEFHHRQHQPVFDWRDGLALSCSLSLAHPTRCRAVRGGARHRRICAFTGAFAALALS